MGGGVGIGLSGDIKGGLVLLLEGMWAQGGVGLGGIQGQVGDVRGGLILMGALGWVGVGPGGAVRGELVLV